MPFADATAISFTQVIYIVVFSALILNERVTTLRWMASVIGTAGALLIVKPAFLDRNTLYLAALLGTSLNGLAFVLNKYLQRPGGDSEMTTMFYVNAIAVACNLPVLATTSLPEPEVCNDNPSIDIAQFDRADQMCEVIRQQVASKSKTVVGRQGRAVAGRPADPV